MTKTDQKADPKAVEATEKMDSEVTVAEASTDVTADVPADVPANAILDKAKAAADTMLDKAKVEAAWTINEAKEDVEKIIAAAKEEAEKIIAAAQEEALAITGTAQSKAEAEAAAQANAEAAKDAEKEAKAEKKKRAKAKEKRLKAPQKIDKGCDVEAAMLAGELGDMPADISGLMQRLEKDHDAIFDSGHPVHTVTIYGLTASGAAGFHHALKNWAAAVRRLLAKSAA